MSLPFRIDFDPPICSDNGEVIDCAIIYDAAGTVEACEWCLEDWDLCTCGVVGSPTEEK